MFKGSEIAKRPVPKTIILVSISAFFWMGSEPAFADNHAVPGAASSGQITCDPAVLALSIESLVDYSIFLGDGMLLVNDTEYDLPLMEEMLAAKDQGVAEIRVSAEGRMTMEWADSEVSVSANLQIRPPFDWETDYGVFPPSDGWIQENLGCSNGILPRWILEQNLPGVEFSIELVMPEIGLMLGKTLSKLGASEISGPDGTTNIIRPITFIQY